MSVSLVVIGFVPPDEKWKEMKAVFDACEKAKIAIPEEVEEFFNYEAPDERGIEKEILKTEWKNEYAQGYEIELSKIPKNVKFIRAYLSY